MGTRNLSAVVVDGEYRVAKYCQWDGYPSGVGLDILNVLRTSNLNELKERIRKNAGYIDDDKISALYEDLGINIENRWISYDDSKRFSQAYPLLSRDSNLSDVFHEHLKSNDKMIYTKNGIDFVNDSLFCEYAYVVDFDKNTFEVYRGFTTEPIDKSERFYKENEEALPGHDETQYYPVRHWHTWSLNDLPNENDFIEALNEECEE